MNESFSIDKSKSIDSIIEAFSSLRNYQKSLFIKCFIYKLTKEELSVVMKYTEKRQKDGIGDLISVEVNENIDNHKKEQVKTEAEIKNGLLLNETNDSPRPFKRTKSLFGKKYQPHACQICDKTFKWNKDLLLHQQTDHDAKGSFNSDSPKVLKRSRSLKIHKRDDTGENKLTCGSCSKTFLSKRALMKHEMTHTREGTFSCEQCSKSFLQLEHLKNHKKIHVENKDYIFMCNNCPLTFYDAQKLMQHNLFHCNQSDLKKHICDRCKKTFSEPVSFKEHEKKCVNITGGFTKTKEEYLSIKIDNVGTKLPVSKSLARLSSVIGFS